MNKSFHNFWIDILLFLLLGIDIALVSFLRQTPSGYHPGIGWHIHAVISILLSLGCLVHVVLHLRWYQAVLTGKAKGKTKLIMQSLVVIVMLLANLSGHAVLASDTAGRLHSMTGILALLGMFIHGIRHMRWIVLTAKRLTGGQHRLEQASSSD